MPTAWKKIILENDNAQLAEVTASTSVNLGLAIPSGSAGATGDNVIVVDGSGNIKQIAQSTVAGNNTTYAADDSTIELQGNGNLTFSVIPGGLNHNDLNQYAPNEHIDWTAAYGSGNEIDSANYTDTTYADGAGITDDGNGTMSVDSSQTQITQVGTLTGGGMASGFGDITIDGQISASGTISAPNLTSNTITAEDLTVTQTLTATTINAVDVGITGSLAVDGTFTFNSNQFGDPGAISIEGSTVWGDQVNDTHYFSGSITASGDVSASTFTGNGGGITSIPNTSVNTANLYTGNGLQFASAPTQTYYDGTASAVVSIDLNGSSLLVGATGLSINTNGVTNYYLADGAITTAKITDGVITKNKLAQNIIGTLGSVSAVDLTDGYEVMISTGSGPVLAKTTILDLATYVNTTLNYTNNTGSVTGVAADTTVVDGLSLSIVGDATTTPTLSLSGPIDIDNANWNSGGTALALGNGGTGQTSASGAANALLNIDLGGAFNIGVSGDTITIPGNLEVGGTVFNVNTTNLEVKDKFILIGSGSTGTTDIGIKFGETANVGNMIFWNGDQVGGEGRFSIGFNESAATGGDQTLTSNHHIAGIFSGSDGDATTANADQVGNIQLKAGGAYIYA